MAGELRRATPFTYVSEGICWGWSAVRVINYGTTCAQIAQSLPTHPDDIVKQDVTIVVCTLKGVATEGYEFSEASTIAGDVRQLCCRMMDVSRPVIILGGASDLWGCHRAWDDMVDKLIIIARSVGCPSSTVNEAFNLLTQDHDHCLSIKSDDNDARYLMMFEHTISVA